jgi:hypothetical protein
MDKTFKITGKVEFDNEDFNRSIDQMQKKLKELYAPGDIARSQNAMNARMGGVGAGFNPMNPGNNLQARREMDQMTIAQNRTNQALAQRIIERLNNEAKISKLMKDNNNLSREEVAILEEKLRKNQDITQELIQQHSTRRKVIEESLNERAKRQANIQNVLAGRGYQLEGMDFDEGGGGGKKGPPGGTISEIGKTLFGLGKVVASVMALAAAGNVMVNQYANLPITTAQAQGSATQDVLGKQLESLSAGDAIGNMAFDQERQEAMRIAKVKLKNNYNRPTNFSQFFSKTGAALTGGSLLENTKMHQEFVESYEAQKEQEYGQDYQKMLQAEMAKNPMKVLASQRFQQNSQRDLTAQRLLGLDYGTYHGAGGYLESANLSGSNEAASLAMTQAIMGAGGSTRGGRSTTGGLQLQAGMNLTNIGGILGKISGQTGNAGLAQQLTERMLEEAVNRGFSKSEFTQEFRQFADIAGTIIANSGAQSPQDAARLTQGFGRFVGDNITPGGLTGAQSAYQEYQQQSSSTSGRLGALQFALMQQDPTLGKLGATGIGTLMEMPDEDLNERNISVRAEAAKANVQPKDIVASAAKAKRQLPGVQVGLSTTEMDKVDKYFQQNGLDESTVDINSLPGDIKATYIKMIEAGTQTGAYGGPQKAEARTRGMRRGFAEPTTGTGADQIAAAKQRAAAGETGKVEDANEKAIGALNQRFLQNFRDYVTVITPAADALANFTKNMIEFLRVTNGGKGAKAPTQTQAGKPAAGKGP